jgi:hypothetical protein
MNRKKSENLMYLKTICGKDFHTISASYHGEGMIRIKDRKQLHLLDPWQFLSPMRLRSNMRRLGPNAIFSRTIFTFLVNLKRHHRPLFDQVGADVVERYWGKKAQAVFSMVKPTESEKTLKVVRRDLFDLIEQFRDQRAVCEIYSYKLMQRLLTDQCNIGNDGSDGKKLEVKKPRHIVSNSLQNPSDPDAPYDGHKGHGYQVQIIKTFSPRDNKAEKETKINYRYSSKQYRLAIRRSMEQTEAFTDAYRWLAGVEATISEYDRLT